MRKTSLIKVVLFVIAILANLNYLVFILNPAHADNLGFFVLTGLADTIAIAIFVSTWTTALFYELNKSRYQHEMAELRTVGNHLLHQRVAVLITVVNEDISIVRNTIQSAKNLIGEKAAYLLDDGKKEATQRLAGELGVRYITRATNAGYKAGNINNALRNHVPEPFFIVVDADFALHPEFIQRTLPLFADPRVAAVQTPQVYSNEETLFSRGCKTLTGHLLYISATWQASPRERFLRWNQCHLSHQSTMGSRWVSRNALGRHLYHHQIAGAWLQSLVPQRAVGCWPFADNAYLVLHAAEPLGARWLSDDAQAQYALQSQIEHRAAVPILHVQFLLSEWHPCADLSYQPADRHFPEREAAE